MTSNSPDIIISTQSYALSESELLKDYPVKSSIEGWFFSIEQVDTFVCYIKAKNIYGFETSTSGSDDADFMVKYIEDSIRRESLRGGMYFIE
ncbi:MAG: hypothetical protein COA90_06705 [Gammaproteobacteria bacterium]|nr:MAG: hypothetical protein COA90_06705 [Gammaproteobacteria bacterium]